MTLYAKHDQVLLLVQVHTLAKELVQFYWMMFVAQELSQDL